MPRLRLGRSLINRAMKLTKIRTFTYDYYQSTYDYYESEDGVEYRVVVRSAQKEASRFEPGHMHFEVFASGEWLPVDDTDTKEALMNAWVRS